MAMRQRLTANPSLGSTTPLTSPSTEPSSRLGVTGVLDNPASLSGVLKGSFSLSRRTFGPCEVWWGSPSLWVPVAQALGFPVSCLYAPQSTTSRIFSDATGVPTLPFGSRKRHRETVPPCLVFCGEALDGSPL